MRVVQLTDIGEHMSRSFGQEPTPAMKILWFIRRRGGTSSDTQIKEFVVDGSEYATAMRKLMQLKAISIG